MDTALKGYWKLDENPAIHNSVIVDFSGNGNNGTLKTNDGEMNKSVAGQVKNAIQFDGVDDYIEVEDNESLDFGTGDFTIEMTVKMDTPHNGEFVAKISEDYDSPGFEIYYSLSRIYFWLWDGGDNEAFLSIQKSIFDNEYHKIEFERVGDLLKCYVDGNLEGEVDGADAVGNINTAENLRFGTDMGSYNFKGLLDEVRIYNRALSVEEIRRHHSRDRRSVNGRRSGPLMRSFRE